jgi:long-chain fatty acid transport protein
MQKKSGMFACLVLVACFSQSALATNGYSPTGFGTLNKGMVGAGVALPQDAMTAATNPAGMGLVGHRTDFGAALFSPSKRGYTADPFTDPAFAGMEPISPGDYISENDLFLVPHFGWNRQLSETSTLGVSIGGNGGMNTEYDQAVFGNFPPNNATAPTGVNLEQLFAGVTYAFEVNKGQWLGVMPIFAIQKFEATGLEPFDNPFLTETPGKVTNNGSELSTGFGIRFGWLGQINDDLTLGVSYQSRLYMSEFDDYAGLFAEQGDFDIPSTWVVGAAYKVQPTVTLVVDFQRINYGEIKSLSNPNDNPSLKLGADDGLGFGWEDMDIIKLGVQWEFDERLTLRAGYSHATKLFKGTQALFNILAPATIRDHVSLGSSYQHGKQSALNLAFTLALNEEVAGSSPFTGSQTGSVEMEQWELEIGWSHFF